MNRRLAIIPARGGSKRIPRKNIRDFWGKPIIAYSIETALNSQLFTEVMVSTDDTEIAEIARQYGANVPFMRSADNANDQASTVAVLCEVLDAYAAQGKKFSHACCLYPTAPLLNVDTLQLAYQRLITEQLDCVFPVVSFSYPVQRGLLIRNGKTQMAFPEHLDKRSQDLEPMYHDAGQFYFFDVKHFCKQKQLWTDNTASLILDELNVQDIDNEVDWQLAELKYQLKFADKDQ